MNDSTKAALRISAAYFFLGALWVLLSDRLVVAWVAPENVHTAQTVKGWAFMATVAVLLFWWVRGELNARARSRETLRTTEANLAILLNQALTGVFVVRDERYVYVNERFAEIFGHPAEALIGAAADAVVYEGEQARMLAQLARTGERRSSEQFGFRGVRADGSLVHAEAQTTLTELDGEPAILGILLDVTQRKVVESQYQAARRLEAIGRMAGGVAHDFKNLLTAITGAAELLRGRERLPPESAEELQVILSTAERGAMLSRQLLAFSQNRVQNAEPVDIPAIVQGMAPLLQRLMHARIRLDLQIDSAVPAVMADRNQIEQIVLNLVVNARDAMPGGGTLRISVSRVAGAKAPPEARVVAGGGQLVGLRVEDSGVGIPRELQARVFEPYFTTKGEQGTGLGLATVQGVVAQTGGHIILDSSPGRTCFSIYFPSADPLPPAGDGARAPVRANSKEQALRVLVVDDEAVVRAVTRRALEGAGFVVTEAMDGASARGCFGELGTFDVVLLDISLPDESGADIARAIARYPDAPPIVFMSGYGQTDVALPGDVHPAGFVEKPFTVDEIARAVTQATR